MSYIGSTPSIGSYSKLDDISAGFNGSNQAFTAYVGGVAVQTGSATNLIISLNGVIQEPYVAYTINGTSITFTTPPTNGTAFFGVRLGHVMDVGTPSDSSITNSKIGETITVAKGGTGQTSASTAINALLPTQSSSNGQFLTTNGSVASWSTVDVNKAIGSILQIQNYGVL